jgi:hypothetical protein
VDAVGSPEADEVTMKLKHMNVAVSLRPIEHASVERFGMVGNGKLDRTQARKLRQKKLTSSLSHRLAKSLSEIREEEKRPSGSDSCR